MPPLQFYMSYFITGTDTGVGKTHVACLILQALRDKGRCAAGFKPIACGDRVDAERLRRVSAIPNLELNAVNPVHYRVPAAPLAAAMIENRPVDITAILEAYASLQQGADIIVVEGAGGWEVPITSDLSMSGLAKQLALPVLVVVNNKLGALNHTILTVNAIKAAGLHCAGILLNHTADERDSASISNRVLLSQLLDVPILAEIMHGEEILADDEWL